MPNPKRRHSQQRSAKRRTHYKAETVTLSKDSTTGEIHVRHRAHVSEGKLYYKGKVVAENLLLSNHLLLQYKCSLPEMNIGLRYDGWRLCTAGSGERCSDFICHGSISPANLFLIGDEAQISRIT